MNNKTNTTICALATAQGGAIGVIRVSGPEAVAIADKIFSKDISEAKGYTLHYGQIVASLNSPKGAIIDDVIVSIFRAPHSYTGEDSVEISCHASSYIQNQILSLLLKNGCTMAEPGEFTMRAFMNGKMDLTQAEAVADIIASQNRQQHRMAMNQLRGGLTTRLGQLHEQLINLTSLLELELDFSDHEDLEFADRTEIHDVAMQVDKEITSLLDTYQAGNAIKSGIPVAIIGAPNVGKSTLLNALLQDDKAIVSDIAGTTRDIIEDVVYITAPLSSPNMENQDGVGSLPLGGDLEGTSGALFRFIDTAGIRHTDDTIENLGIERSIKAAEKAQVIILMRDPENDFPELTNEVMTNANVIRVTNKTDDFQALTGKGLDWLKTELLKCVPQQNPDASSINARHKNLLEKAREDLRRAIAALDNGIPSDLVAEDLRLCNQNLSEMTGQISSEDVLHNIFSRFCIGK